MHTHLHDLVLDVRREHFDWYYCEEKLRLVLGCSIKYRILGSCKVCHGEVCDQTDKRVVASRLLYAAVDFDNMFDTVLPFLFLPRGSLVFVYCMYFIGIVVYYWD